MRLRRQVLLWGVGLMMAGGWSARAAEVDDALPPAIRQALPLLSSENYADRQKGVRRIQGSLSRQVIALGSVSDPEASGDVASVLTTTDAEIRWLLDVLKAPDAERKALLEFAGRPGAVALLGSVFNPDETERLAGIHRLSGMNGPGVDLLVAQLVNSEDRAASLAAMEVAWDGKPTDAIVESLWQSAVVYPFTQRQALGEMVSDWHPLTFRGRAVDAAPSFPHEAHSDADSEIATEVLIHLGAPHAGVLAARFLSDVAAKAAGKTLSVMQLDELSGNATAMRNSLSIAVQLKVTEALPSLYVLAMLPSPPRSTFMDPGGGVAGLNSCSERTGAVASFLIVAGLPHEGFEERDFPHSRMRHVWVDTAKAEEDASARISEWWQVHGKEYSSR